jgi:hypothetical protein
MSYLKDLNKLSIPIQLILSSAILMPFIYTSIYFFNFNFYKEADLIILVVITYIISFLLLISIFMVMDFQNATPEITDEIEKKIKFNQLLLKSILLNLLTIILIDFVTFSIYKFTTCRMDYYWHILIYFIPFLILFLESIYLSFKKNKKG